MKSNLVLVPPPRGCRWKVTYGKRYVCVYLKRWWRELDALSVDVHVVDKSKHEELKDKHRGDKGAEEYLFYCPPMKPRPYEEVDLDLWDATGKMVEKYWLKRRRFSYSMVRPMGVEGNG